MKRVILPEESENFHYYKANLHCHSLISDGHLSPEEIKALYQSHGYSAVAYTDHDIFLTHNDLTDDSFIALNGIEYSITPPNREGTIRHQRPACHICMVAKTPDILEDPIQTEAIPSSDYQDIYVPLAHFSKDPEPYHPVYSGEAISGVMRKGHEKGFFVTYNHPNWSGEYYEHYSQYSGMDAMEIVNGGCNRAGYHDNAAAYEELLRLGRKIYCVCADDNHNGFPAEDLASGTFTGFVKVAAPSLTYTNLTDALSNGCFFSGTGNYYHASPDFVSVVYDDETREVHVKARGARQLICQVMNLRSELYWEIAKEGQTIDEKTFVLPEQASAFQLRAVSEEGYRSYSNAVFI